MRQVSKGWLFREAERIVVQLNDKDRCEFDLGRSGEEAARNYVTDALGQEDWTLRDMAFLGHRIMVPSEKDERASDLGWNDYKANGVTIHLKRLRPKWSVETEWFNGMIMIDIPIEDRELRLVVGNANETLGADVYLTLEDLEQGIIQDESIDTGVNADEESVLMIAGSLIGAIETYLTYIAPTLLDRKEMIIDEPKV